MPSSRGKLNPFGIAGAIIALVSLVSPWAFIDIETETGADGLEPNLPALLDLFVRYGNASALVGNYGFWLVFVVSVLILGGALISFFHPGGGALTLSGAIVFALILPDPRAFATTAAFVDYSYGLWLALLGGAVALTGLPVGKRTTAPAPAASAQPAPQVASTSNPGPQGAGETDEGVGNPVGSVAGPPESDWISGVEASVRELQRSIREQEDFLFQLDRGLLDGRVDNATYHEIRRTRWEHIGNIRGEVEALRRRLQSLDGSDSGGT